jgi:hypothetical protein
VGSIVKSVGSVVGSIPVVGDVMKAVGGPVAQQLGLKPDQVAPNQPYDFGPRKTFEGGREMAKDILGPEGLKSKEMADVMQRRKQALEGMGAKEIEGLRSAMTQQQQAQAQQAQSRMSGQLGGARGGRAAMQQQNLMSQAMAGRMGIERDIMLQNEQVKRQALDKYEGTTRFDVSQMAKEKELLEILNLKIEVL